MASITIRRLDDDTKKRLRIRASQHGRSMEEEAREILKLAVTGEKSVDGDLGESIRRRFAEVGGVELHIEPR